MTHTEPKSPRGEIVWVGHYGADHELKFITTSKPSRDYYYLYEVVNGEFVRLGKERSPPKLEEKYITPEKLGIAPPPKPERKRRSKASQKEGG